MVTIFGKSYCKQALKPNDIFLDSGPSSFGVTDNGMGVCTALELLRYFVHNPPRQTIIFLFNNMEEGGLVGAKTFVNHPWYSTVKLFLNLGKYHYCLKRKESE
jgi:Zn-dependent M28 family amino/carboxypeptidase